MGLSADPNGYAFCGTLKDRFGDAGIVGVLLARLLDSTVQIEEWVLSCRVFGRGVENAMFNHLVDWLNDRGHASVEIEYCATDRNKMIVETLEHLGFSRKRVDDGGSRWEARNVTRPKHSIKIEA